MRLLIHNIISKHTLLDVNGLKSDRALYNYKLFKAQCSLDVRKYFFANRVVDSWNSLPSYIVSAPSLQTFKKLLNSYEFVFDNMLYH